MDIQWLQATFPSASGGLGFTTEKIPLGDQIFGRADLAYVIAYRMGVPLIEALVPPRLDHSRIDWVSGFRDLRRYFLFGNPNWRIRTSDLNKRI